MNHSFFSEEQQSSNIRLEFSILREKEVSLWIKREDTIHPEVSGNKFRKLKYNIREARKQGKRQLLTFGGAYSNHILATAAAGNLMRMKTIGVIRGDELGKNVEVTLQTNSTLKKASDYGMRFVFLSREAYRDKMNPGLIASWREQFGEFYTIPEGGTNELAVKGCQEILTMEDEQFDYICSCVGTGGTISGIILRSKAHQKVLGFPALKGDFLKKEIQPFVKNKNNWQLVYDYHFGGYGKYTEELIRFINAFREQTHIALDPIYTGKMMFGIFDKIKHDQFPKGSKILAIHTGGLQGIEGFNHRLKKKNSTFRIDT